MNEDYKTPLAKHLSEIMRVQKLRPVDVAERMGASRSAVTRWMKGEHEPQGGQKALVELAHQLHVPLELLTQGTGMEYFRAGARAAAIRLQEMAGELGRAPEAEITRDEDAEGRDDGGARADAS